MARGSDTRHRILDASAALFNTHGYAGTSISDVMAATDLRKGGIYGHFESKQTLAAAAFEHAVRQVGEAMDRACAEAAAPVERLTALVGALRQHVTDPLVPGGSPVFNAAVEADDAVEALRPHVRKAMDRLLRFVQRTVERGVRTGELRADVDAAAVAALFVSALEGAVVLARLYGDVSLFDRVAAQVTAHLTSLRA